MSFPFTGRAEGAPVHAARRRFMQGLAAGGVLAGLGGWPRHGWALATAHAPGVLAGTEFDLRIGTSPVDFTGKPRTAVTVNGSLPAPLLRWREGSTVNLRVSNALPPGSVHGTTTSLHWHGIVLPANMDGVPGLSFDGIGPGQTYQYRFDVRQGGTYWYHSHSGFQEQAGLYGPLIIDPAEPEPFSYQRDYVVLLSDWTDLDPAALFARLKKMSDFDNYAQRTVGDFVRDARRGGLRATLQDRAAWGQMRMTPTDLSDVNGNTYTYLLNGTTTLGNWTGLFKHGERVRLRLINGSSMTHFDVRIPGLKMTVVAADGQYVHPVTVDELRIATAETFDVIVTPSGQDAFTVFAQDLGRTGYVAGTLATREGLRAPVPAVDARPILSMADMGHGAMVHGAMDHAEMGHAGIGHGDAASADGTAAANAHAMHGAHQAMGSTSQGMQTHPESERGNPLVDMQTMSPTPKLDDPGIGLRGNGRDVLSYARLRSLFEDPDGREPGREIELHLTGHMEKFAWSFDGLKFDDAKPLRLNYGERLRIVLVNDTMMTHPIHLHGMWSDLEDAQGEFMVRKHTVDMPPGTRRSYRVRADALGSWAYHCHLLYHMEAGMMRQVQVVE
ncbi:copper resistance system multicopper oxidase [Pseudoxanthomonas composti]|uniref:Copper resistance system multicopper oxidase n=1 Tax=Pseudoxanthomonas composti TaxID=2137479 RepID=A0A4Q1JZC7_9GAMM|nr:copper resistance system multicopper oxidase [Pseudoxanthomonas composti]RXR07432.1 copper resistance system multicopper oxidase [Pseudoxanthomonas composti]